MVNGSADTATMTQFPDRTFQGTIENGTERTIVRGLEAVGHDSLRLIRDDSGWPREIIWQDGRRTLVPRKARAHAAITVLRPESISTEHLGACIRWAVFLPLDDDPQPSNNSVVETGGVVDAKDAWNVILPGRPP